MLENNTTALLFSILTTYLMVNVLKLAAYTDHLQTNKDNLFLRSLLICINKPDCTFKTKSI